MAMISKANVSPTASPALRQKALKKAFLLYPPTGFYMRDDRCQAPVEGMTAQPPRAPIDLATMAAVLEENGMEVIIKDYPAEDGTWEKFRADFAAFMPDMLAISATTPTLDRDMMACKGAKEMKPDCITVIKGAHFTGGEDSSVMEKHPYLDIAIRGESELTVKYLAKFENPEDVLGVTYRRDGKISRTQNRERLDDLDRLPFPARHLLNNKLYLTPDTRRPITLINTARGCPFLCTYCAVPIVSGQRVKIRSPESVVEEIQECIDLYGIRDFFFRADTFTWDKKWVIRICQLIVERGLKIRWGANSRCDSIDEERLTWMKKAGCYVLAFGAESAHQETLDKVKKKIRPEQTVKAVTLTRKHGIKPYLLMMIGFAWETPKMIQETIDFACNLPADFVEFAIPYPLPGTEMEKLYKEMQLIRGETLTGHDYTNPTVDSLHCSRDQLLEFRRKAITKFYTRPSRVLRHLAAIRSPYMALNYAKAGLLLAKRLATLK